MAYPQKDDIRGNVWVTQGRKSWYEMTPYERQEEVYGLQQKLWKIPDIPKEDKERPLLDMLTFVGGVLNIPSSMISGAAYQLLDAKPGFEVQEYFKWVFGDEWRFKNQGSWSDVIQMMAEANPEQTFWDRKVAQIVVGLSLDIILDPLTYIGAGLIKGGLDPSDAKKLGNFAYNLFKDRALTPAGKHGVEAGAQRVAKQIQKLALGQSYGFKMPWSRYVAKPFGKGIAQPVQQIIKAGGFEAASETAKRTLYEMAANPRGVKGILNSIDNTLASVSRNVGDKRKPGVYNWFKKAFMPGTQAYEEVLKSHEKMRSAIMSGTNDIIDTVRHYQNLARNEQEMMYKYLEGFSGKIYKNGAVVTAQRRKAYYVTRLIKHMTPEEIASPDFFREILKQEKGIKEILRPEVVDIINKFRNKAQAGIYAEIPVHDIVKATEDIWNDTTIRMLQGVLSDAGYAYDKSLLRFAKDTSEKMYRFTDVPEWRNYFSKLTIDEKDYLNGLARQGRDILNKWFDEELEAGLSLNYIADYMTGLKMAFKGKRPALEIGGLISPYMLHREYDNIDEVINNIASKMINSGYVHRESAEAIMKKTGMKYRDAFQKSWEDALKKAKKMLHKGDPEYGKILDTVTESLYMRGVAHYKSMARKQLIDEVKQFGNLWDETLDVPHGFARVLSAKGASIPELKGYVFTEEVGEYLTRLIDTISNDEAIGALLRKIDDVTGWWKVLATSVNPGFHMRNMYSNHFLGWISQGLSYFNPKNHALATYVSYRMFYGQAAKEAARRRVLGIGQLSDEVLDKTFAHGKTLGELARYARDRGLLRREFRMQEVIREEGLQRITKGFGNKLKKISPISKRSFMADFGEIAGSLVENQARFAAFLNEFNRSGNMAQALDKVQEVYVNYLRLSPFEQKVMRKIVPFWTWMKQNTANQFKFIFSQPGRYAVIPKLANAVNQGVDNRVPDELQPTYFQDLWMWQLPINLPNGVPLFFNPNLPFQDLNRLSFDPTQPGKSLAEFGRKSLSSISPFLKIPLEVIPGYDLFRRQPLERYPGYKAPVPGILQPTALFWYDKFPDMAEKIGLRYENGTMTMNPKVARALENLFPFINNYARALAATPNKENYENIFQMVSYLAGIKIKPLPLLRQRKYYLQNEIKQRKDYWEKHQGYWYGF